MRIAMMICSLLVATTTVAQSPASALTGTWHGVLSPPGGVGVRAVTMEHAVDERSVVTGVATGPQLNQGDIRNGTYDPVSGALKFEVVVRDGASTTVRFDGLVVQGTAIGRVTSDDQSGLFKLTRDGSDGMPASAQAQSRAPSTGASDVRAAVSAGFGEVSGWVRQAACVGAPHPV